MNEKEKMTQGLLYNAGDPVLLEERLRASELFYEFNNLHPRETEKAKELIRKLLGGTKENFKITPPFFCDYGYNIKIGENFYTNYNCVILDPAEVVFGDNVFIGPNCGFYTAGHPLDKERRDRELEFALPIIVGDSVWIGGNVVVAPGVRIGNDVVIGAGSVVTKDVPDGVVAAGNPCRVLRSITSEDALKHGSENSKS